MENRTQLLKSYIPIAVFGLICLTSISLKNVAGLTIIFAILYLFIENKRNKGKMEDIGFIPKNILSDIRKYWWLILIPAASGIVSITLSRLFLPDFYLHVLERTRPMLSLDKSFLLIPQLLILAFGEEIAFRAFFQTKICNITKPIWAIIITSLFFAIGHFSIDSIALVIYDLIFIFIDSVVYGIIYQRTKNVYSCTISHFIANVIGIFILLLI
ncbi:lysostaphin resistance A-like protein [Clostridium sp.]|uniref:lysostaphin resistance A-like protein n=1 Tax=Clostridium sp. TaxID=1506 RepID=UPI003FD6E290